MDLYLKALAATFLAVILTLTLGTKGKEFSVLLSLLVCVLLAMVAMKYLHPVVDFLSVLKALTGVNDSVISVMLKITGIGIITEIATLTCADSGNSSLGKSLQLLGSAVILWMALPLFSMLMELLQRILGDL